VVNILKNHFQATSSTSLGSQQYGVKDDGSKVESAKVLGKDYAKTDDNKAKKSDDKDKVTGTAGVTTAQSVGLSLDDNDIS